MKHTPPSYQEDAFNCLHCQAFANQTWHIMYARLISNNVQLAPQVVNQFEISSCARCGTPTIWRAGLIVYPMESAAPLPNEDLPDDIKNDYNEARNISNLSPRGAAALLRLAIQKLCKEAGEPGENINDDIKALVKKGLPAGVQKALDSVRVIGNNSVHPGVIDLKDDVKSANSLFSLVNFICEKMFSDQKKIDGIYSELPKEAKDAIEKRDK